MKFLLLVILVSWAYVVSCYASSDFYTAAVLEHVRFGNIDTDSPDDILQKNLDVYKQAVETASLNKADIIVFPECGLYPHVKTNRSAIMKFVEDIPDPKIAMWNPCEEIEEFKKYKILRTLSCLAQANKIFIVANIGDIKKCEVIEEGTCNTDDIEGCSALSKNCRPDGVKLFNANVVLDRNGTLVSRYYKRHLYFEPDMDLPDNPEHAYFETDFGLFTTFTCFDIMFEDAVNSIKEKNVKNVAFPTYWFDHLPLMSAIQYHQGWAVTNKVNLLASNIHLPGSGTIGSGVYSSSRGALVYTFNPDGRSKLLISEVPNNQGNTNSLAKDPVSKIFYMNEGKFMQIDKEDLTNLQDHCSRKVLGEPENYVKDYRCFDVNITDKVTIQKLTRPSGYLESCHRGLCCSLEYEANVIDEDYYLVSASFVNMIDETSGFYIESCYMVRCDSYNAEHCSTYPMRTNTTFERVKLTGNFTTKYVYPSIVENEMRLALTKEWKFSGSNIDYTKQSADSGKLMSVGLEGRAYDRDPNFAG